MRGHPAHTLVVMLLVLAGGPVRADQPIAGKRLVIKNPSAGVNRMVHLGRDASVTVAPAGTVGDPQCSGANGGGSSSLRVTPSGGGPEIIIPLPCGNFTTNAANTYYRYDDPSGATCRLVLVRSGSIVKVVCKGTQVSVDVNASMAPVTIVTTLNSEQYCTTFGGTIVKDGSNDRTFVAKDAPEPSECPQLMSGPYCCGFSGRCSFMSPSQPSQFCVDAGGTPSFGASCDGTTGNCVPGPGAAGPCCESVSMVPSVGVCAAGPAVNSSNCTNSGSFFSTFYPSAECTESGSCD